MISFATMDQFRSFSLHFRPGTNATARKRRFLAICEESSLSLVRSQPPIDKSWTDAKDRRRCALIDRSLHEELTAAENRELADLQREAEKYFDVVAPPPMSDPVSGWEFDTIETHEANSVHDTGPEVQWMNSAEAIIERLEWSDSPLVQRVQAAILAETIPVTTELRPRLLNGLFEFANEHRLSENEQTLVAVGAAIRKFALNMHGNMLDQYSKLFVPSETQTVSCRVELELAKGANWRLAMLAEVECKQATQLEYRLTELATDYLTARLILQDNYAAIALNALLAIVLLNGEKLQGLITRVESLRAGQHHMTWFRELFADRLMEAARKQAVVDAPRGERMHAIARRLDANLP